jgi:hypothetical protein
MPLDSKEKTLLVNITRNINELQQSLQYLGALSGQADDNRNCDAEPGSWPSPMEREEQLKSAIADAINELEESRKGFKSKRSEQLRKKLTKVLLDLN